MWYSYHSSGSLQRGPPEKYCLGHVQDYHDFYNYGQLDTQHDFYLGLKRAVEQVMSRASFQNSPLLFFKALFILGGFLFTQYNFTTQYSLFWCILYSFFCSQVGVNVMHDGNHLGFSSNNRLSYWMGYALDWTGSSSVVYRRSHNFGHHGCVNHYELDRAFDTTYPLIRLHPH
jgi:fatty acid desaturase